MDLEDDYESPAQGKRVPNVEENQIIRKQPSDHPRLIKPRCIEDGKYDNEFKRQRLSRHWRLMKP